MEYLKKKFTVAASSSQQYRDSWEQTFRGHDMPDLKTQLDAMLKAASAPSGPAVVSTEAKPAPPVPTDVERVEPSGPTVIHTKAEFIAALVAAPGPVAVEFVMQDCEYCEESKQEMAAMLAACPGALTALRVDVDEVADVADEFDVDGTPTVLFAKDAKHFTPKGAKELEPDQIRRKLKCARAKR